MKEFGIEGHEPSLLPEGDWTLVWADEFDGTELDRTKWDYRLSIMGKRHRTWVDDGVHLDGESHAVFTVFERDGEICSSQLQTGYNYMDEPHEEGRNSGLSWPIGKLKEHKFLHRYGYYECRCRLQQKEGWWSAFWLQSPVIGCSLDPSFAGVENDIMESFQPGKIIKHCNHWNGYGVDHKRGTAGSGMELDKTVFHRFGMLWDENGYTFYVDGKQDGERIEAPVSHIPQFILISTEVNGYRAKERAATPEARDAVGDTFVVDYVRVF
ncbi:MAG: glycoside hydrolase family 16 protein, partial [Clostridia bacterium]|nr:glycoside hydrolase family 16 protein [Clostridia bacterium]